MTAPAIIAGAAGLGQALLGNKTPKQPRTANDLRPMRRNLIDQQNYMLGFSPDFTPYVRGTEGVPGSGGLWQGGAMGQDPKNMGLQSWMNQQGYGGGWGSGPGGLPNGQGYKFAQQNTGVPQGGIAGLLAAMQQGQQGGQGGANNGLTLGQSGAWAQAHPQDFQNMIHGSPGMPMAQNPTDWLNSAANTGGVRGGSPQAQYGALGAGGGYGPAPWQTMSQGPADNPMTQRMENILGPLGTPTTALQRQSLGGISQFLGSDPYGQSNNALRQITGSNAYGEPMGMYRNIGNANYFGGAQQGFQNVGNADYFGGVKGGAGQLQNANLFGGAQGVFNGVAGYNPFGAAQTSLEGMLGANPGQGVLDALRPQFERNLAAANQEGGRFGSANAILRSRALDDYNLLGANALQKGVDQQIAAAGQYGVMGNNLINARLGAGQGLLGVGQGQVGQQNAALQAMLGAGQGQLQQGLGAAQGLLGVGQGRLDQGLGAAGGLGTLLQALQGNRLAAAGQMAGNQNSMFGNLMGGYGIGQEQAKQEAERNQQAQQIYLAQQAAALQASMQGSG